MWKKIFSKKFLFGKRSGKKNNEDQKTVALGTDNITQPQAVSAADNQQGSCLHDAFRNDDLRIVNVIDSGNMGQVFICHHDRYNLMMAVKRPKIGELYLDYIRKEASAWIRLGLHPHIACCYWVKIFDGCPYVYIEYVPGTTLGEWISQGKCHDLAAGLDIAVQICQGVLHAHNKGLLHRDIKPSNILIDDNGKIKITDFGLAWPADMKDHSSMYASMKGIGTPAYMPPEQWHDFLGLTPAADIFSIGICMWMMLLGVRPYESNKDPGPLPDIKDIRSDIPAGLEELLKAMVCPRPDDRPQSVEEVLDNLGQIYKGQFGHHPSSLSIPSVDLSGDSLNNRGVSYWELGEFDKANVFFARATAIEPGHGEANFNLGRSNSKRQHYKVVHNTKSPISSIVISKNLALISGYAGTATLLKMPNFEVAGSMPDCVSATVSSKGKLFWGGKTGKVCSMDVTRPESTPDLFPVSAIGPVITSLACSSQDGLLAAGDISGQVAVLTPDGDKRLPTAFTGRGRVVFLDFLPEQQWLLVGHKRGSVALLDIVQHYHVIKQWDFTANIASAVLTSTEPRLLLAALESGEILGINLKDGEIQHIYRCNHPILDMSLENGKQLLAILRDDNNISLISLESFNEIRRLSAPEFPQTVLCFDTGGGLLLSGDIKGNLLAWKHFLNCQLSPPKNFTDLQKVNDERNREISRLQKMVEEGRTKKAVADAFQAWKQEGMAASSRFHSFAANHRSKLGTVQLSGLEMIGRISVKGKKPLAVAFSGLNLQAAWNDGTVSSYSLLEPAKEKSNMALLSSGANLASFSNDGSAIAFASNNALTLFKEYKEAARFDLSGMDANGGFMQFSEDANRLLLYTTASLYIFHRDATGWQEILQSDKFKFCSLLLSPNGESLAWNDGGAFVNFYSCSTMQTIKGHRMDYNISSLAWSPNGKYLSVTTNSSNVLIIKASDGDVFNILKYNGEKPASMSWSPDSRYIALSDQKGSLFLGTPYGKKEFSEIETSSKIKKIVWSGNGQYLGCTSGEEEILIFCTIPKLYR